MPWQKYESVLYKIPQLPADKKLNKIAAFDLDSTLILDDRGAKYATSRKGFVYAYPNVQEKLIQLYKEGFIIVIFSNRRGAPWSYKPVQERIDDIEASLGMPIFCFFATKNDEYRKPKPGMMMLLNKIINIEQYHPDSFYCGDAVGPTSSNRWFWWSDADSGFATNVGLPFRDPTQVFEQFPVPVIPNNISIVITIGQDGSGWDVNLPSIGQAIDFGDRILVPLDDNLTISKEVFENQKPRIYYVLGSHPTEAERLNIIRKLGGNPETTAFHVYMKPSYDEVKFSKIYSETLQLPKSYIRCN
jgi:DNA 3'-phosphatase